MAISRVSRPCGRNFSVLACFICSLLSLMKRPRYLIEGEPLEIFEFQINSGSVQGFHDPLYIFQIRSGVLGEYGDVLYVYAASLPVIPIQ